MSERRGKAEIVRDVLLFLYTSTDRRNKPTRIMYGSNLSWNMLQGILEELIKKDLINEIGQDTDARGADGRTNTIYELTRKGEIVLRFIDALDVFINDEYMTDINIPLPLLRQMFRARFDGAAAISQMFDALASPGLSQNTRELGEPRRTILGPPNTPFYNQMKERAEADQEIMELIPEEMPHGVESITVKIPDAVLRHQIERGVRVSGDEAESMAEEVASIPEEVFRARARTSIEASEDDPLPDLEGFIIVKEKTVDGAYRCPLAGCVYRGYTKMAVKQHLKVKHGVKGKQVRFSVE